MDTKANSEYLSYLLYRYWVCLAMGSNYMYTFESIIRYIEKFHLNLRHLVSCTKQNMKKKTNNNNK